MMCRMGVWAMSGNGAIRLDVEKGVIFGMPFSYLSLLVMEVRKWFHFDFRNRQGQCLVTFVYH